VRGGANASGIDCFAEIVAHEWQHRVEEETWWRESKDSYWYIILYLAKDLDYDGVPHSVEESEPGCIDADVREDDLLLHYTRGDRIPLWYTCNSRPFPQVTDRELYAYDIGWNWGLGTVDNVDWSEGGKQW
jgi:hypothetical protein